MKHYPIPGINCNVETAQSHLKYDLANCSAIFDADKKTVYVNSEPCLDDLVALLVIMTDAGMPRAKDYFEGVLNKKIPHMDKYSTEPLSPFTLSEYEAWVLIHDYFDRRDLIIDIVFSPGKGGRTWVHDINEPQMIEALAVLCYKESGYLFDWEQEGMQ